MVESINLTVFGDALEIGDLMCRLDLGDFVSDLGNLFRLLDLSEKPGKYGRVVIKERSPDNLDRVEIVVVGIEIDTVAEVHPWNCICQGYGTLDYRFSILDIDTRMITDDETGKFYPQRFFIRAAGHEIDYLDNMSQVIEFIKGYNPDIKITEEDTINDIGRKLHNTGLSIKRIKLIKHETFRKREYTELSPGRI